MNIAGIDVIESNLLPMPPSDGQVARRIVRHGLARYLEWLGEDVGRPGRPDHHTAHRQQAAYPRRLLPGVGRVGVMTLVEFLRARCADDEAWAAARSWPRSGEIVGDTAVVDRLRREVAAKRAILAEYEREVVATRVIAAAWGTTPTARDTLPVAGLEFAIKAMASVYANHEDYQKEWA